jgi:hypothetical protein
MPGAAPACRSVGLAGVACLEVVGHAACLAPESTPFIGCSVT